MPSHGVQEMTTSLRARVGIVLLNEFYLTKKWTVWELRELMKLLTSNEVRLLPVLYSMDFKQLGDQMKELSEADNSAVKGQAGVTQRCWENSRGSP